MTGLFIQENRMMGVTTPLGKDAVLLHRLSGSESISRLFHFKLDLLAENRKLVEFDKLLGQKVTVRLAVPTAPIRFYSGIVSSVTQGHRSERFTNYGVEVVPELWLLTRRTQSRIFQHITVPDILKKVLSGLNLEWNITGTFYPRDYCVQYRESDFDFASRLMEEEGIFYFFKHSETDHTMVVTNQGQIHPDLPEDAKLIYEEELGGVRDERRIHAWIKVQELRSGKTTLWDHCFELPHKHLEAEQLIKDSVAVGKITHKLNVGGNEKLEIYDYPGGYAQRFDGVAQGGAAKPEDLQRIFQDNRRTVAIRMEQEAQPSVVIKGTSTCPQMISGHKFTLTRHFNCDGQYYLTSVTHNAQQGYDTDSDPVEYSNEFTCSPVDLPFRPARTTPRPVVRGTQTAVVVGPAGEEIFTDKYGRIKVQFHWDREGKYDSDSSCWIRVSNPWAGKQWGMVQIPRIGQEVIVDFLEGDPDQPIVLGSVYNADQMPPYKLPDNKVMGGWKSNSSLGGGGYNEISFNDTKSKEMVTVHAQYDMGTTVEHDDTQTVHNDRNIKVDGTHTETITKDTKIVIEKGPYTLDVQNNTHTHHVKADVSEFYEDNQTTVVTNNILIQSAKAKITVDAAQEILLHCGQSMMSLKKDGTILISGQNISVLGAQTVKVGVGNQNVVFDVQKVATSGAAINSNAVGMHTITGAVVKIN